MSNSVVKEHNKLVRNLIPEIIVESGSTCEYDLIEDPAKHGKLLVQKLNEEGSELYREMLFEPKSRKMILEELADVYEVFLALCSLNKINPTAVVEAADAKRKERGGFERGVFLKTVTGGVYEHDAD
jgi:predicted house-cleaning noncanonical NTP pyrophosphatase (MazG superfamily)